MIKEITRFQFEGKKATMLITDEYERFKFIEGNRNPELATTNNTHSKHIAESIKEYGYLLTFVTVNEKMEIIDGQHRFGAVRELNLPVYVIKIDGYHGREMQVLNMTNEKWKKVVHANYWSMMGKKDYTDLIELWKEFPPLTLGTTATLLSNPEARKPRLFNNGDWKITKDLRTMRANLILLMELRDIQPQISNRSAAEAFMAVAQHPKYNHRRMKENMDSYGGRFWENFRKKEEFLMMFTSIYNYARPKKNRIFFASQKDIEEVANARMKKAS